VNHFAYNESPYPIREEIRTAYRSYWQQLASAGSWWSGAERVAIAQEVRNATNCEFCSERKQELSPYALKGVHNSSTTVPELAIDAVHRIVTDQTRITKRWVEELAENDLSNEAYVELAGIVVAVFSIDEFNRALGLALETLPESESGEPSHYRPQQAVEGTGFVAMLPADGDTGKEAGIWPGGRSANVLRALTLVPNAFREWLALSAVQYIPIQDMVNMVQPEGRVIDRMQIELVAGRVSAINQCFY